VPEAKRPSVPAVTWSITDGTGAWLGLVVVVVLLEVVPVAGAGTVVPLAGAVVAPDVVVTGGVEADGVEAGPEVGAADVDVVVEVGVDDVDVVVVVVVTGAGAKTPPGLGDTQTAAFLEVPEPTEPTTTRRPPQLAAASAADEVPGAWGRAVGDQLWPVEEVQTVAVVSPPANWVPATSHWPVWPGATTAARVALGPPPRSRAVPLRRDQAYCSATEREVVWVVGGRVVAGADVVVGTVVRGADVVVGAEDVLAALVLVVALTARWPGAVVAPHPAARVEATTRAVAARAPRQRCPDRALAGCRAGVFKCGPLSGCSS